MNSLNQTETLISLLLALIFQIAVLYFVIQEATFSKRTKKNLDAMRELLAQIALKQGVDPLKVETIEKEFIGKQNTRDPDQKDSTEKPKWD